MNSETRNLIDRRLYGIVVIAVLNNTVNTLTGLYFCESPEQAELLAITDAESAYPSHSYKIHQPDATDDATILQAAAAIERHWVIAMKKESTMTVEEEIAMSKRIKAHWQAIGPEEKHRRREAMKEALEEIAKIIGKAAINSCVIEETSEFKAAFQLHTETVIAYFGE